MTAVIRSETAPTSHAVLHWYVDGNQWAVRQGDWKLIGNVVSTAGEALSAGDKKLFLSNIARDDSETRNLANDHAEVVQRLLALHQAWFDAQKRPEVSAPFRDRQGNEK
jgi:arylsulfatase A-like enzyme